MPKIFLLLFLQNLDPTQSSYGPAVGEKLGVYGIRNEKNAYSISRNSPTGENNTKSSDQGL
jgi:hypothetical protein